MRCQVRAVRCEVRGVSRKTCTVGVTQREASGVKRVFRALQKRMFYPPLVLHRMAVVCRLVNISVIRPF